MSNWNDIQDRFRTARKNIKEVLGSARRVCGAGLDASTWTEKLIMADDQIAECQQILGRLEMETRKNTNVKYPMVKGEVMEAERGN
jgi:hypothetical protein